MNIEKFDKLTESQKADIIKTVEATAEANKVSTPQKIDEYVTVGVKVGQAFASCAKELGVAVNDFIKTPAGKITLVLIIWKVMAIDIIHIFGAAMILVVGCLLLRAYYRSCACPTIEYDPDKVDIFRRSRIKKITRDSLSDGQETIIIFLALVIVGATCGAWFSI
jgi:hypothetical protein